MRIDRRQAPRYRFIADAEVIEIFSRTNLKAQTSDLSIGGCFLDMLSPSPKGVEVEVRICHAGANFTARGRVAFVIPNMGMGISFTKVDGNQVAVLQGWISDLSCDSQI
jgi:hypothetical protein